MPEHQFRVSSISAVAAALLLSSCCCIQPAKIEVEPPTAKTADEIANVYVSAYPVIPWASVAPSLAPARNWKIADASAASQNVTSAQTNQTISSVADSFALTFPTIPKTTSGSTSAPATATVPSAPSLPALAALTGAAAISVTDGAAQLESSTGLFQQSAILDAQIPNQYLPAGYSAYLVTFQINLQPKRWNWPYDAYVDIHLMPELPEAIKSSDPPVIINPVIIADAMEATSTQNSEQRTKQLAAEISAGFHAAGIAAGTAGGEGGLADGSGYEKNSLVTAGLVNGSTIHVRLGAEASGLKNRVMVPRTYNVSLLVLTKATGLSDIDSGVRSLIALTKTTFSNSSTGDAFESGRDRQDLAQRVVNIVTGKTYGYASLPERCAYSDTTLTAKPDLDWINTNLDFLRAVDSGNYPAIRRCLQLEGEVLSETNRAKLAYLLTDIVELQDSAKQSRIKIFLKDSGKSSLPEDGQIVLLSQNTDATLETATVFGGEHLSVDRLHAKVQIGYDKTAVGWLVPNSISVTTAPSGQNAVLLTYPVPSSLKILGKTATQNRVTSVDLTYDDPTSDNRQKVISFKSFMLASAAGSPQNASSAGCTKLPISASASILRVSSTTTAPSSAILDLAVGDIAKFSSGCSKTEGSNQVTPVYTLPLHLIVKNANLVPPSSTATCITASGSDIVVSATGKCIAELTFTDLTSKAPVVLQLQDAKGTALPGSVTLEVVEPLDKTR